MPPALKKTVGGLPLYVWIGLTAGGIAVGFYIKHKDAKKKEEEPSKEEKAPVSTVGGAESNDPCNPSSSAYNPVECEGSTTPIYQPYGANSGELQPTQAAPSPAETKSAAEGGATAPLVTITQNQSEAGTKPCSGSRPKKKKGYNIQCVGGKWAYEPTTRAGAKKKNKTANMTGGGAPSSSASEKLAVG